MTQNPTLYILCGLPFAGKSTVARALAARSGCAQIEIDAINTARGLGLDGSALSAADWHATYQLAFDELKRTLTAGQSASFDATNYTRAQRGHLRALATAAGAVSVTIFGDVAPVAARRRWLANRARGASERNDVRDDDFQNVLDHFEPPAPEERTLRYDGAESLEVWLRGVDELALQ